MSLPPNTLPYLSDRFRRGAVVLFTGAGFSSVARNHLDQPLPVASDLTRQLWSICYPDTPPDPHATLQDIFEVARASHRGRLSEHLKNALTVDDASLPPFLEHLLSLPWLRIYTLSVDDLFKAIERRYALPRRLVHESALPVGGPRSTVDVGNALEVAYLNGTIEGIPDDITFSVNQYAGRLAERDPIYGQCVADLLTQCVIFVGTVLNEPTLWQHLELRRRRARTPREFRPRSYLVATELDRARRDLLEREFNVVHIPMTLEQFWTEALSPMASVAAAGLTELRASVAAGRARPAPPRASECAANDVTGSPEYLLGRYPTWGDLRASRAIPRSIDPELVQVVRSALRKEGPAVLLLSGTAGSGKSTAAMRLALALESEGVPVSWVDNDVEIDLRNLRRSTANPESPPVLIIDDADRYGVDLCSSLEEIVGRRDGLACVIAMRSSRADRIADRLKFLKLSFVERTMPHLSDMDIRNLIVVLDRENRLGVLKGASPAERVAAFRERANRQLLVAMLEATSGLEFEKKIVDEMVGLEGGSKEVYVLTAVATALRFGVSRDEILQADPEASNAVLAAIDVLVRRNLVIARPNGDLVVRHRVIADVILNAVAEDGSVADVLDRLGYAFATKVFSGISRQHRSYRRVRALMNHEWLKSLIGAERARAVLANWEDLLNWDHHYWLQRGSLEVESGELGLAENFLNQAYTLESGDPHVQTELGYLRMRQAVAAPTEASASDFLEEGLELLEGSVRKRGETDPHPYQIMGDYTVAWADRPDTSGETALGTVRRVIRHVEDGVRLHPSDAGLKALLDRLRSARDRLVGSLP